MTRSPGLEGTTNRGGLRIAMVLYGDVTYDSRVQREANSLAGEGHSVTIFCLAGSPSTASALEPGVTVEVIAVRDRPGLPHTPSPFLEDMGVVVRYLRRASWLAAYGRNLRSWGRAIARQAGRFDVWHAHDFSGLVATGIARPNGSALVYDLHDLHLETDTGARLPGPARRILRSYERRLLKDVDLVVTVNEGLAAYHRRHFGEVPIAVVHNCVPTWTQPEPRPTLLRDATRIGPDEPIVLYHGLIDADRGLEATCAAMLEPGLERAHLVLMGFGKQRPYFSDLAQEPRYGGRIHLVDPVPPADLMPWVASADVGVMPNQPRTLNDRLSTPNKLFESIGAGLPVVSSDFQERREIILDASIGPLGAVCDPTDPSALAIAIRSIIELEPAAFADLRQRCASAARVRWNWDAEVRQLVEGYRRIADARRSAGGVRS